MGKKRQTLIHLLLYVLTFICIFLAGFFNHYAQSVEQAFYNGLVFAFSAMAILTAHEAGHYVMAKKHGINTSLPYFIPVPPFLSIFGTFGAIIVMKGRIKTRDALMDIGAAGPISGMIVAVIVLYIGLHFTPIEPLPQSGFIEGQSLLYIFLKYIVHGPILENHDIIINYSPMAFAGWFGILITALNLLPIGQLDGGHIFYALFGKRHEKISRLFHKALFVLGLIVGLYYALDAYKRGLETELILTAALPGLSWVFLGVMMYLFFRKKGFKHPPTDDNKLSPGRKYIGIVCIILFIITFMPFLMRPIV